MEDRDNFWWRSRVAEIHCQVIVRQEPRYRLVYLIEVMPRSRSLCQWSNSLDMSRFLRQLVRWSVSQPCSCLRGNSLPTHSIQNPMSWNNQVNLFRYTLFESSVSATWSAQSIRSLIWFQDSSDSSIMDFLDHSSSSTLTRLIVPWMGSSTTGSEAHNIWSRHKVDGELRIRS